jgi:hypothetical protein
MSPSCVVDCRRRRERSGCIGEPARPRPIRRRLLLRRPVPPRKPSTRASQHGRRLRRPPADRDDGVRLPQRCSSPRGRDEVCQPGPPRLGAPSESLVPCDRLEPGGLRPCLRRIRSARSPGLRFSWLDNMDTARDGALPRGVFVASRTPREQRGLTSLLSYSRERGTTRSLLD